MDRVSYIVWDATVPNNPDDDICDHCGEELLGGTTVAAVVLLGKGSCIFWCEVCQRSVAMAAIIDTLKAMDVEGALK